MRYILLMFVAVTTVVAGEADSCEPTGLRDKNSVGYAVCHCELDRMLQRGEYASVIRRARKLLETSASDDWYIPYCLAGALASSQPAETGARKLAEESLAQLRLAIARGFRNVAVLESVRFFKSLRTHESYRQIVRDMKAVERRGPQLRKEYKRQVKEHIGRSRKKRRFHLVMKRPLFVVVLARKHEEVQLELAALRKTAPKLVEMRAAFLPLIYEFRYSQRLKEEAKSYGASLGLCAQCLLVQDNWAQEYGIRNLPAHLLISAKGEMLYEEYGALTEDQLEVLVDVLDEMGW